MDPRRVNQLVLAIVADPGNLALSALGSNCGHTGWHSLVGSCQHPTKCKPQPALEYVFHCRWSARNGRDAFVGSA